MSKDKAEKKEAEAAPEDGAEGEAPAKKKPPLMILIAAGVGALVILGGGGTTAFLMLSKPADPAHAKKEKPKKKDEGKKEGGKEGKSPITEGPDGVIFYNMPDLTAAMQPAADGKPIFLKLKLTFELPDKDTAEVIEENQPRLNDMFQTFLRELRQEDLNGSQGDFQLRAELQKRVNLVIAPAKVNAVLIQEMLTQ